MFKRIKSLFDDSAVNFEILRCDFCGRVITNFSAEKGILCKCGQNQFRQTNPNLMEKIAISMKYIIRGY